MLLPAKHNDVYSIFGVPLQYRYYVYEENADSYVSWVEDPDNELSNFDKNASNNVLKTSRLLSDNSLNVSSPAQAISNEAEIVSPINLTTAVKQDYFTYVAIFNDIGTRIVGHKTIDGAQIDPEDAGKFTFVLTDGNDKQLATAKNDEFGNFSFSIKTGDTKQTVYKVKELSSAELEAQYVMDGHVEDVVINVSDGKIAGEKSITVNPEVVEFDNQKIVPPPPGPQPEPDPDPGSDTDDYYLASTTGKTGDNTAPIAIANVLLALCSAAGVMLCMRRRKQD